jgi:hypothetical protein
MEQRFAAPNRYTRHPLDFRIGNIQGARALDASYYFDRLAVLVHFGDVRLVKPHELHFAGAVFEVRFGNSATCFPGLAGLWLAYGAVKDNVIPTRDTCYGFLVARVFIARGEVVQEVL